MLNFEPLHVASYVPNKYGVAMNIRGKKRYASWISSRLHTNLDIEKQKPNRTIYI